MVCFWIAVHIVAFLLLAKTMIHHLLIEIREISISELKTSPRAREKCFKYTLQCLHKCFIMATSCLLFLSTLNCLENVEKTFGDSLQSRFCKKRGWVRVQLAG